MTGDLIHQFTDVVRLIYAYVIIKHGNLCVHGKVLLDVDAHLILLDPRGCGSQQAVTYITHSNAEKGQCSQPSHIPPGSSKKHACALLRLSDSDVKNLPAANMWLD